MKDHSQFSSVFPKKHDQRSKSNQDISTHDDWSSAIAEVRFGLCLGEPIGLQDALELGAEAEKCGFDVVSVAENLFWWEPGFAPSWDNFIALTTLANRTSRIKLMTTVIGPIKRHPVMIAHMAATLDQVSSGRLMLGIGAGEIANFAPLVDLAGTPPYRLFTRTKEFMAVLHGIWASTTESPFSFEGRYLHVEKAYLSLKPATKPHPPIYLAALGPKMRQFTGQVANGWYPIGHTPETYTKHWQVVKASAESAGRNPNEIDRALGIYTAVLKDGEKAKEIASILGRDELSCRPDLLRELGYSELALDHLAVDQRATPFEAGKVVSERIPRVLGERVTICGTPKEAIQQLEEFIQAGVRMFIFMPIYADSHVFRETIEHYRNTILPHFAKQAQR